MEIKEEIYLEDLNYIIDKKYIKWDSLMGETVLVTGATGLIGSWVVKALLYANEVFGLDLKIIALVRSLDKAKKFFADTKSNKEVLKFVVGSVEKLPNIEDEINFIVHGANPTASLYFVEHPVETVKISVQGTINLLDLAVRKNVLGFVYLSSMEVYGAPHNDTIISENSGTTVDTMLVRSCYPEAKRMCESLCTCYSEEYNVPAKVIRLAQTFGPGVDIGDQRVFAEFARNVMGKKNIVLQTFGNSKRCYLYTADAVTGILTILLSGEKGQAYNLANVDTYCSINEMAHLVAKEFGENKVSVITPDVEKYNFKFSPEHRLKLDTRKVKSLGWDTSICLAEMYARMMKTM